MFAKFFCCPYPDGQGSNLWFTSESVGFSSVYTPGVGSGWWCLVSLDRHQPLSVSCVGIFCAKNSLCPEFTLQIRLTLKDQFIWDTKDGDGRSLSCSLCPSFYHRRAYDDGPDGGVPLQTARAVESLWSKHSTQAFSGGSFEERFYEFMSIDVMFPIKVINNFGSSGVTVCTVLAPWLPSQHRCSTATPRRSCEITFFRVAIFVDAGSLSLDTAL